MSFYDSLSGSVSTSGLVGYWTLDNTIQDSANVTNNGTASGGSGITFQTSSLIANTKEAVFHNTLADTIKVSPLTSYTSSAYTINTWIRTDITASIASHFFFSNSSRPNISGTLTYTGIRAGLTYLGGPPAAAAPVFTYSYLNSGSISSYSVGSSTNLEIGKKYFVSFVAGSDNTYKLYIDGKINKSTARLNPTYFSGLETLGIGGLNVSGVTNIPSFSGSLDETSFWQRDLSASEIQSLFNSFFVQINGQANGSSTASATLGDVDLAGKYTNSIYRVTPSALRGYWPLDGNVINQYNNVAGITGSTTSWNTSIFASDLKDNKAAVFDGTTNSFISLPESGSLTNPVFSVGLWVNANSFAGTPALFANYNNNGNAYGWLLNINTSGKLGFGLGPGGSFSGLVNSTTTLTTGKWYYVAATYDGGNTRIYVNGNLEASTPYAGGFSTAIQLFGRLGDYKDSGGEKNFFNGKIDEVSYWNKALSATEIKNMYQIYVGVFSGAISSSASMSSVLTTFTMLGTANSSVSSSVSATLSDISLDGKYGNDIYAISPTHLKAYWNFDNNLLNQIDRIELTKHVPTLTYTSGIFSSDIDEKSLYLNTQKLDVVNSSSFSDTEFSVGMWIKPYGFSGNYSYIPVLQNSDNSAHGWVIEFDPTGRMINFVPYGPLGQGGTGVGADYLSAGKWNFIVFTYGADKKPTVYHYRNNSLFQTFTAASTSSLNYTGTTMYFGNGPFGTYYSINEVSYWNKALTATEVQSLFDIYADTFSATSTASSDTTAELQTSIGLSGSITGDVFGLDTNSIIEMNLSGDQGTSSFAQAELSTGIKIKGDINSITETAASLTTQIPLNGDIGEVSVVTAGLTTNTGSQNPGNNGGSKIMSNPLKILTQLTASKAAIFKEGLDVNSQKITSVADGTVSSDAINLGQLTGLSSSLKTYVDAGDTTLQGNLNAVSGAMKSYVDAQNAAQDTATSGLSSSMKSYVDAQNTAQDLATSALSSSIVSYVDAGNAAQDAATSALSSSMATKIEAVDSAQTAANAALSSSMKSYVDAANSAQDAATSALSSSVKGYVDAANAAQDAATTALSSSLVSKIDAADAALSSSLMSVSSSLKSYVDAADTQLQSNLDSVSGSLKSYVDAQNSAQDLATSTLSSSIKSYVDAADAAQDAATAALSSSIISYVDAADTVLQGNLDSVSGAMKSYVDAQNAAQDSATAAMSSSIKGYIDAENAAQDAATSALSSSVSSSIAAEAAARVAEDLTFLKLDGSRAMEGALDMGGQDIVNAKSGSFSGDMTVGGNLTVNGQLTYINSTNLEVTDKLITVAKGAANGAAADGAGLSVDGAGVSFVFDNAAGKWVSDIGLGVAGEASFDGAMKLSGSAFTNITTPVVSGKFDVSDAIHALDLKVGANAQSVSDAYDALRLVVTGTLSSGTVTVDLSDLGGAQFVTAEMANIALDVMVDADNTGFTNDLVAIKMFADAGALKVQIDAPATPTAKFRLIAVNEKDGGLA